MIYNVQIDKDAEKFILKQDRIQQKRLLFEILELKENPKTKSDGVLRGQGAKRYYKKRIGDYRIVYQVFDNILLVRIVDADNRGDIYKRY